MLKKITPFSFLFLTLFCKVPLFAAAPDTAVLEIICKYIDNTRDTKKPLKQIEAVRPSFAIEDIISKPKCLTATDTDYLGSEVTVRVIWGNKSISVYYQNGSASYCTHQDAESGKLYNSPIPFPCKGCVDATTDIMYRFPHLKKQMETQRHLYGSTQ